MAQRQPKRARVQPKPPPTSVSRREFPCIKLRQDGHDLFLFTCPAKELWQLVQVNRKVEDKEDGYQRVLSEARARKIAAFVDEGNMLPLSVLISFDAAKYDLAKKTISVPNRPDAGWVIDGQHRLAGSHLASSDISLPVVGFIGLSIDEQINSFVTINREQKGVPTSLYFELLKSLPGTKTEAQISQQRAVEIAEALRTDPASPFFGKIVTTTTPVRGQLSLTNFVRKVTPLVRSTGLLMSLNVESRPKAIANLYKALAQVFPRDYADDSIFFKTLGFGAMMNTFSAFFVATVASEKGFTVADAAAMLKQIEDFNFDRWKTMGTGDKAERDAGAQLLAHFQAKTEVPGTSGPIRF